MASTAARQRPAVLTDRLERTVDDLQFIIEQAAHFLPSQGPLSVFVHHNTLHALEDFPFADALERAVEVYGCQPYLSEDQYRQALGRGRIRREDLTAVLEAELADDGDELVGLLGTRFYLRLAMLEHPLHSAASEELRWVVAETDALRKLRDDVPQEARARLIDGTRRWIMRSFRNGRTPPPDGELSGEVVQIVEELLGASEAADIENWSSLEWESLTLQLQWRLCCRGVSSLDKSPIETAEIDRPRDAILEATAQDTDELVHEVLIRLCSAFLDQGFGHWALPNRDEGLWRAFLLLYSQPGGVRPRWLAGLPTELQRLLENQVTPLESIEESLELFGVSGERRESFIRSSLLALRGWAGMIWQMETNAEWAVRPAPKGTLASFLAIRLLLDRYAITYTAREYLDHRGPLAELCGAATLSRPAKNGPGEVRQAFIFFELAQFLGLRPEDLAQQPPKTWARLAAEVDAFSELQRRRIFHLAYERRYRNQALDALVLHGRRRRAQPQDAVSAAAPDFQLFCCIDDREESFRRHLEEVYPRCETFGYAGFYGVAMFYRGAGDAHPRPLCPVVIKPKHYVEELPVVTFEERHRRRARTRRLVGDVSHRIHRGSRSLVGGAFAAILGSLASAPLVGRILFPRAAAQLRRMCGQFVRPPEVTQLLLERTAPEPGPEPGHIGFSLGEMADIVERTLRDIGLTSRIAPLVILCGHGSSSLNNPHESAYSCGACSGARGGPNARAFAQMANDPRVRAALVDRGLSIPTQTYFVGAFHNTCNDLVEYFDLDRMPLIHKSAFEQARRAIDEARERNAHERCRRFESAPLAISPKSSLAHVEERAEDLSQARPEYNHATNAVTYVGRRSQTRGLYMDRRCFLASYDPLQDDEHATILARILSAVFPVCAGISLEYYFSCVDVQGYGCGSKLPHNIVSLLGVMEGAAGDLRPGLSAQMTEIHEPLRNLFVIETTASKMQRIIDANPVIGQLCRQEWVQLAISDPHTHELRLYCHGAFELYQFEGNELPQVSSSMSWYRGWRDHLGFAEILPTVEDDELAPGARE